MTLSISRASAFFRFVVDVVALILAGVAVVWAFVPENPETRLFVLIPYFAVLATVFVVMAMALGVNRTVWRFTSLEDLVVVAIAIAASLVLTLGIGFVINRLDGVFRSLPLLQGAIAIFLAWLARAAFAIHRQFRTRQRKIREHARSERFDTREHILVVGVNQLASLYITGLAEFAGGTAEIAGLLSQEKRHTGRLVQQYKVLGQPVDIIPILGELRVHGVDVATIVVAMPFEQLSKESRDALLDVERRGQVVLVLLSELLRGYRPQVEAGATTAGAPPAMPPPGELSPDTGPAGSGPASALAVAVETDPDQFTGPLAAPPVPDAVTGPSIGVRALKRFIDVIGALVLSVVLLPIAAIVAVIILFDDGTPIMFWQKRPGLNGRLIRIYKFRTMRRAHDDRGHRVADSARTSAIGRFLRRARFDEIPQLYHVLFGEMSFVGPRPLLPSDQTTADHIRLSVRPGITGYAQVCGCNRLSVQEKMLLDAWYVENMSLRLDIEIVLKTIRTLLSGEHRDEIAIARAKALGAVRSMPRPLPVAADAASEEPPREQSSAAVIDLAAERRKSASSR